MRSMTGYGRATATFEGRTLTVQVSSVNRRSLDLTVGLPEAWTALEPMVGELVRGVAAVLIHLCDPAVRGVGQRW